MAYVKIPQLSVKNRKKGISGKQLFSDGCLSVVTQQFGESQPAQKKVALRGLFWQTEREA